jgi:hypothetical protein
MRNQFRGRRTLTSREGFHGGKEIRVRERIGRGEGGSFPSAPGRMMTTATH